MQKAFVTSDGAEIRYTDQGTGDTLLLLHGWSQSAAMFRHQIGEFSKTYRVIAPDFRGHGVSPKADRGYRIYRFAADVAELMDEAGVDRANVLGWSMGASILWAFIDIYGTSRLEKLIFVDEPASVMRQPDMTDEEAADAGSLFDAATMAAIAAQIGGPEGHAARGAFLGSMITKGIASDLRDWLLAENLIVDGKDVADLFLSHCLIDWSDIFDRVDRQTLIIGGHVSHVAIRSQQWIHSKVKGSKLVLFEEHEGGAHFPFLEAPDNFNRVLAAFLADNAA